MGGRGRCAGNNLIAISKTIYIILKLTIIIFFSFDDRIA